MNRSGLLIALLMACLVGLLWKTVNTPIEEPPWPDKVQGFAFSPFRGEQSPNKGIYPTVQEIDKDLTLLAGRAHAIRVYTVAEGPQAEVPRLAIARGLNVTLGAWISPDEKANKKEIAQLIKLYKENFKTGKIVRVLVGNEAILRGDQSVDQMIQHIKKVKKDMRGPTPVSTAEPWHIWHKNPKLVEAVDFMAVHLLPYWEGLPVDKAVAYSFKRYEDLKKQYPGKPIMIAETGWPSDGRIKQGAVPSQANQAQYLRRFLQIAEEQKESYYIMEAFDQIWKRSIEGEAGAHWGVYDDQRQPKFKFTEPLIRMPHWQEMAAYSIAFGLILLLFLCRDSAGLMYKGNSFLALIAFGIASFGVWLVYDFQSRYMTVSTMILGIFLLLAAVGAILVILIEAHEWAESLWIKDWRRLPGEVEGPDPDSPLPMVSIHVPTYNEPPDMMVETLDALAALDYPNFEVLVIDNNTKDPAVWQPVKEHCQKLGERFRFFHVDPLSGFKAGALNYTLQHTAPQAEVVAVIDSDYQVVPGWLKALVPYFKNPEIAIVQAPQDYRDGDENAFKAMCLAEYRGFFQIGMITRNERNAIIQHGTMTMVRRTVLDEVGGWGEWCITEDAELGLRIFEKGYAATYVPVSYGRGLIPDTFLDYKKQRFRWAYGSVLILRHHMMTIFGLKPSKLTNGQRYHFLAGWLPWFADGINLLFNLFALAWTFCMVMPAIKVAPPHIIFACLPVFLFLFKMVKMFFLYRNRVTATRNQSIAAGLAGLSLSHTIARAMLTGFITSRIGFFRTPKNARANALVRALGDAREELLFVIAFAVSVYAVLSPEGATSMLDVRIWALVLTIQSIPYLAAVLVSLISGMPWLSAKEVGGAMPPLNELTRLNGAAKNKNEKKEKTQEAKLEQGLARSAK